MSSEYDHLKNEVVFAGLCCYRYLCETWKREHPHDLNLITDWAKLKFKSDQIQYEIERQRYYDEFVRPYKWKHTPRKYAAIKNKVDSFNYQRLTDIYKVSMNPTLNPFNVLHED